MAVVGKSEIEAAQALLEKVAKQFKGSALTYWQKRKIARLAPQVAVRRKAGRTPVLSRDQAIALQEIVATG